MFQEKINIYQLIYLIFKLPSFSVSLKNWSGFNNKTVIVY